MLYSSFSQLQKSLLFFIFKQDTPKPVPFLLRKTVYWYACKIFVGEFDMYWWGEKREEHPVPNGIRALAKAMYPNS